jgi:oxygen-independent coproporphyrinogen III oxidase
MAPYAGAVAREAAMWSPHVEGRPLETVFFGGGTPSLMPLPEMTVITRAMGRCFDLAPGAEVSLEANPGTVDAAHLAGLRRLGFNRISFGVQSFHDDELLMMERIHSGDEVADAYRWAREAGFDNVNLDLIYGLAGQTMQGWQENVEKALAMGPEHLSLYALTLEEGTPLTRDVGRGRSRGPDLDLQADMFEWSRERLAREGFDHYEVSNWARPGRQCRHNLIYWHNDDWLGLGAGAHSHLLEERFAGAASPSRYITLVNESQPAASQPLDAMRQVVMREEPDRRRELSETVILALRLREGLDLEAFRGRFGVGVEDVFPEALEETLGLGLTEVVVGRLRVRDEAVLLGDEAFIRFLEPEPVNN